MSVHEGSRWQGIINGPFPPAPLRPGLTTEKLERCKVLAQRKAVVLMEAQEALDGMDWSRVMLAMVRVIGIEAEMRGIDS